VRVVITGATGNVGTAVVEALVGDDSVTEVVGLARRPPSWEPPKTRWVACDLAEDDLEPIFRGADAVVHLAWIFQPTHDPLATWVNNVGGAIRVFDGVGAAGVPVLVHASSVGAYAPGPDEGRVDESWPTHAWPTAAYGREKSYVERVLDGFERDHPDVRVVRLRPGFIFTRRAADEQRRLFGGPFLPGVVLRRRLVPLVPDLPGFRFQALHSADAGQAFRLAVVRDVRGPFNVAAEPVLDAAALGELLGARPVRVPYRAARAAVTALWRLHLVPASPFLLDLVLSLPLMDTTRAREELGWQPTVDAPDALAEVLDAMGRGEGGPTPQLASDAGGPGRVREVVTGVGGRAGVTPDGR
jgi:nucleoside-diphosphate-sugar epimerase